MASTLRFEAGVIMEFRFVGNMVMELIPKWRERNITTQELTDWLLVLETLKAWFTVDLTCVLRWHG